MNFDRFDPIALRVERIGPFEEPFHLDLVNQFNPEIHDIRPTRFFLLASQNAKGKTTLLESFAMAMSILNLKGTPRTFSIAEDIAQRRGRIQLDICVALTLSNDKRVNFILSLSIGKLLYDYTEKELATFNSPDGQAAIISTPSFLNILPNNEIASKCLDFINIASAIEFNGLFSEENTLPTTLFFTADRGLSRPSFDDIVIAKPGNLFYNPCHVFSREEGNWRNSIDNLLCWYAWLSRDGEDSETSFFKKACELINTMVINEPDKRLKFLRRDPPEPLIQAGNQHHRLDRLSSGERVRLQLLLRTASLMTAHTTILIDELELHLHPVWQHQFIELLINLLRTYPGLRVIYTTHSKELVERGLKISSTKDEVLLPSHKIL